jgi:hypothetical protein
MARKDHLDMIDDALDSAALKETQHKSTNKEKKVKTINLSLAWEDSIKEYFGGTVSGYITMAIQEQMKRDGIL